MANDNDQSRAAEDACIERRFLHMWFGEKERPLVEFAPVQIIRN
jgi:hypothetical protein